MRLKSYEELFERINTRNDIEENILQTLDHIQNDNKIPLEIPRKIIMEKDENGIVTSYPNNEVRIDKVAIRRKLKYIPIYEHKHEYIEIVYVLQGSFIQEIKGRQIQMSKGDLCIFDRNVVHSSIPLGESDVVVNIILTPEFFDGIFMYLLSDDNNISNFIINSLYSKSKSQNFLKHHVKEGTMVQKILENLLLEYYSTELRSSTAINGYFLILFTELSREISDRTGELINVEQYKVKEKILKYIRDQYKDTNLNKMANSFNFHPSYLSSLIKKEFGKNLKDLLLEVRMTEASKLLKNTDMTIENIVHEVGYTNYSHFYKVFKKTYGMTPNQYKTNIIKREI
ncbi:helix-turn-helix domain-containing protein [Metabacillus litoralis]|uniref:Helix-turn-helix domain-containing protein n=1 Tax=Metabacillus litoralis TaxID=152268 RepID=A0A5C6W4D3_9BACI|nr:AraC family transcriptional regulator [Metabacillus litoralis]TXC90676.1 helix-turn-helix domain-containing protein [Metabacillus litoralis]